MDMAFFDTLPGLTFMLVVGLALLALGGDKFVESSEQIANRLGLSAFVIGLTIVAFGTSAPEMLVAIEAVLSNTSGIASGNIVGSNIANILFVIGVAALFCPVPCNEDGLIKNMIILALATFCFLVFSSDGKIEVFEGISLFVGLLLFLYTNFITDSSVMNNDCSNEYRTNEDPEAVDKNTGKSLFLVSVVMVVSCLALLAGAEFTVNYGGLIAQKMGISADVIGLTIIALGTSLPELVTVLAATLKGRGDMGVGAIVGSNIFNLLAVGGVSAIVSGTTGINVTEMTFSLAVMGGCFLLLVPFVIRKSSIGALTGVPAVVGYAAYIYIVF
jgi:cation:H+ antiporter